MPISEKTKGLVAQMRSQKTAIIVANEVHIAEAESNMVKWKAENTALQDEINALATDISKPKSIKIDWGIDENNR